MQLQHQLEADQYDVFISYSRADAAFAATLYKKLSSYRAPGKLNAPRRRLRVFRDVSDIYGSELDEAIRRHLNGSARLIVLCSPASRASRYVDAEIRHFATTRGADAIVPVLVDGAPNDEVGPADERQAFSDALIDAMGGTPLAVDYRNFEGSSPHRSRYRAAWYQLLAGIYGLSPALLEQRDRARMRKRARIAGMATIVIASGFLALALRADHAAREARSRELADRALALPPDQADLALLLSSDAVRLAPTLEARGALLATLERDRRIVAYLRQPDTLYAVAFAEDGSRVAAATRHGLVAVWDLTAPGEPVIAMTGADATVLSAAFSPDGGTLVAGDAEGRVYAWIVETLELLGTGRIADRVAVRGVTLSPDGRGAAAVAGDSVHLLELPSGRLLQPSRTGEAVGFLQDGAAIVWTGDRLESWQGEVLAAGDSRIRWTWRRSLALSPDGRRVARAAGSTGVEVIDTRTGATVRDSLVADGGVVGAIAWTADGERLLTSTPNSGLLVWNARTWRQVAGPLTGHSIYPRGLAAGPGTRFASGTVDGTVIVWDAGEVTSVATRLDGPGGPLHAAAFSPDGRWVIAGDDAGRIQVWDVSTRERVAEPIEAGGRVNAAGFAADGLLLVHSARGELTRWSIPGRDRNGRVDSLPAARGAEVRIAARGDLLAAGGHEAEVVLWDLAAQPPAQHVLGSTGSRVLDLAFAPDGSVLAASDNARFVHVWALRGQQTATARRLEGHTAPVGSIVFDRSGERLFSADASDRIRVWDVRSGTTIGSVLDGPADYLPADALAISPDALLLAHGHDDGRLVLWDLAAGRRLGAPLQGPGWITDLAFSPDGSSLAAVSLDGSLTFWDMNPDAWIQRACGRANRTLNADERRRYLGREGAAAACDAFNR